MPRLPYLQPLQKITARGHRLILFALVASLIINAFLIAGAGKNAARNDSAYPLLAKRIFLEDKNDTLINFAPLRSALELYLSRINAPHGLYFEYLFTGTSIRLGENSEFVAASLMKIPLIMDLYKAAEMGKVNLDQLVEIKQSQLDKDYGDLWQRGAGAKITLKEAAELTLKNSDNTAAHVVQDNLVGLLAEEDASLTQLDVPFDVTDDSRILINARAYASFLKCLYLACYINKDHSQVVLAHLTKSPRERVAQPVPSDIAVAHKIGTFSEKTQSDCGIIYAPERHYLLCAMIELPHEQADAHLQRISQIIYQYTTDKKQ